MLKDKIQSDLKSAQIAKDAIKLSTLRMLWSEIRYGEIAKGQDFEDSDVVTVVQREIKKRREAAEAFKQGGREEQAQKEEQEVGVLSSYLPTQISDEELGKIIDEVIAQTGATTIADIGKVIGQVMVKVVGQAEGARVSNLVKERLNG